MKYTVNIYSNEEHYDDGCEGLRLYLSDKQLTQLLEIAKSNGLVVVINYK